MIRLYDQTVYSDPVAGTHGDCTRACVRTLLQADLPTLPHPVTPDGGQWNRDFWNELLDRSGVFLCEVPWHADEDFGALPRVVMAGGPTARTGPDGNPTHMVVWDRLANRCLHDPHPSRAGLLSIQSFYWLEHV